MLKAEISKQLQTGMIQGKNPRALARELKKALDTSTYNAERLMRTELARVQTEAQKQSFEANGFELYILIPNSGCCELCTDAAKKDTGYSERGVYKVSEMMPGENAAPLHPHCRCSCAAWEDSAEYEAWLEHLDKGGTTEEWEKQKKINYAKAIDSIIKIDDNMEYTPQDFLRELQKSPVGVDTIKAIRDSNVKILLKHGEYITRYRGRQQGDIIELYENNIANRRVAGQSLIHEMAHYRFNIGGCQHAEAICFAMEKMHIMGKDFLTKEEWEYVKKLAIDNYSELEWEKGGYGNYEQFDFVR